MFMLRTLFALAVWFNFTQPVTAQGPAKLFGVAHLANESDTKCTVYYKWGKDGAWQKEIVEKGKKTSFSWEYDGVKKSSPDLYVRIDVDTKDGTKFVEHTLSRGAAPDKDSEKHGNHYVVKQLKGTNTRYIEVVNKDGTVAVTDAKSSKPELNSKPEATGQPAATQGPAKLFGVAHLANESNAKCTVYYKWGKDGAWQKEAIEKGKKTSFFWEYNGTSKSSPDLYVRIDVDTDGTKIVEHTLTRGQSPDADSAKYGHIFVVKQLKGTDTRFIEAVSSLAKVVVTDAKSSKPEVK